MRSILAISKHQIKQLRWILGLFWILLISYIIAFVELYPGDSGMKDLVKFLQDPAYQFFFGLLPKDVNFYYGFWYLFGIISFMPLFMVGFGTFLGVDVITREEAEKTFDIGFSIPQSRMKIILIRVLDAIGYIIFTGLIGVGSSYLCNLIFNQNIDIDIFGQLWYILTIQALFGLAFGVFIGVIFFDRSFGLQLAFMFVAFSYILYMLLNVLYGNISAADYNNLKAFSIINYMSDNVINILFLHRYDASVLNPLLLWTIFLLILAFFIFLRRDILEVELKPLYVYFNPKYWLNRKRYLPEPMSGSSKSSYFSISLIIIAWSKIFKKRYPLFVDELRAHGFVLTIYAIYIFVGVFFQLILYKDDTNALNMLNAFVATPLYYLISGNNYNIMSNPYLGFGTAQYYALTWVYFLPYVVYRFYHMELRDQGKTDEILWSRSISQQKIFIQRLMAIFTEYYILTIFAIVGFLIPDIYYGKTANTLMEIFVSLLTGPVYLSIGLFISIIIVYIPKYGKYLGISAVIIACILFLLGSLNKNVVILAQLTPFYYFDAVGMLYIGLQLSNIVEIMIFIIITFILIILRLRKTEQILT